MKNLLKIEELLMFALSIYFFAQLEYSWWLFPVFLLAPDIGLLGYLKNPKTGALIYNIFHHKGIAIALWLAGMLLLNNPLIFTGIILFAHSSMDRMFGYGLKFNDGFNRTHLGDLKNNHSHKISQKVEAS